ncbi:MAG TPA: class I SAM-dependent methyltransferase [Pirellulales bacterium]|jgi:SAM-dependent methyltransferase|nr:class I SAM-dependent methyltransferase [Pirellulales bacterium]
MNLAANSSTVPPAGPAPLATSYDEVPYPRLAFSYTHPSHLATIGRLLGLRPAPVDRCRVLELGCAGGSNLVPMAYGLPGSMFVGIDLAERQIADGRTFVADLGLKNVVLEQMDICAAAETLARRFEPFDYIIAHGIYSWVSDAVKDALLAACRRLLAPQGIAYVSYNCYPGGYLREITRQMCLYHSRGESDPRAFAAKNRAFLESLLKMLPAGDDPYRATVREQAANLLAERDSIMLHDVLERDNDSQLLHEFLADAASHRLQYLGDAHFSNMLGIGIDSAGLEQLRRHGGVVDFQQQLDFLYGRGLATTLLCRDELTVEHRLVPEAVRDLWIASSAVAVSSDGDNGWTACRIDALKLEDASPITFRTDECRISIAHRVGKAAMLELCAAQPKPLRFDEFAERVERRLSLAPPPPRANAVPPAANNPSLAEQLARMVIRWFGIHLVELSAFAPPLATEIAAQPVASAVARYQVAKGWSISEMAPSETSLPSAAMGDKVAHQVTNLFHRRINFGGELVARVLLELDGRHDLAAIVDSLAAKVLSGEVMLQSAGPHVTDAAEVRRILSRRVEDCIADLARSALLIRPESEFARHELCSARS